MSHERFTDDVFETKWRPGAKPEFHGRENKQRPLVEERNEADRINKINIEFLNMLVLAVEIPDSRLGEKPKPKDLDAGLGFLDIIDMILEMIIKGVKAILPKGKGETNTP